MTDRYKRLKNKQEIKGVIPKKKIKKEGPIIKATELAPREYVPSRVIEVEIPKGKSAAPQSIRIPGKPFKRNFIVDKNDLILLSVFAPHLAVKMARRANEISANDMKRVKKILKRCYKITNNCKKVKIAGQANEQN